MDADWSTLPMDLIFAIVMKLEYIEDFIYVSVVCRWWSYNSSKIKHQWRSVPVPWLLLAENKNNNPNYFRRFLSMRNGRSYHLKLPETFGTRCWGTAYGWVVMIERDLNVRLFNPLTKAQIPFPSSKTIPNGNPHFNEQDEEDINWFLRSFYKVIVVKVTRGDHHEFVIMILNRQGLCFARPEKQSWTVLLTNEQSNMMLDIVGVNDKVFGLFKLGQVVYWNVKELKEETIIKPIDFGGACPKVHKSLVKYLPDLVTKYLVEFDGDFLMILRHKKFTSTIEEGGRRNESYETDRFNVFRLDPKEKHWVRTKDLGGAAMFIGGNSSIAIPDTLVTNAGIYFTDDEYQFFRLPREHGGHDIGVFFIKANRIVQLDFGKDARTLFCPPTWFIPNI